MKILIAEDDSVSRKFLNKFLSQYGECDLVVDGLEAVDAYLMSKKDQNPYDLICLDIMMPKLDGITVLQTIRDLEKQQSIPEDDKVKIIMTTALSDVDTVRTAFQSDCEAYASKPIDTVKFVEVLQKMKLL